MLSDDKRKQLEGILVKLDSQGAPPEDIRQIVDEFKVKFDVPETTPVVGTPPAGIAPLGTLPKDIGASSQLDPTAEAAAQAKREFVEDDLPSQIASNIGLAGKVGIGIITTLPTGFKGNVASAAIFGGIDALEESTKSLAFGESPEEAARRGATAGVVSAGTELALGGLFGIAKKAVKSDVVLGTGRKLARSKTAQEGIESIAKSKRAFGNKYAAFKDKVELATKKVRSGLGGTVEDVSEQITKLDSGINDLTLTMNKQMSESIGKVKKFISGQYDEFLDGADGDLPVNIDQEINEIANSLNIPSFAGGAKSKLSKLVDALKGRNADPKAISQLEGIIERKAEDSVNIVLRDAHWIKMALNSVGETLSKDPVSAGLGGVVKNTAKTLGKNIDNQVGGRYAEISGKWRDMKGVEEAVDTSIGRLRTLFGETKRKGKQRVQNKIVKAAKEGTEITDDMLREQDETIEAIFAQADLLEKNGFDDAAGALRENLTELSSSLIKKENIVGAKKFILKLAKDTGDENATNLANTISNIERETGKDLSKIVSDLAEPTKKKVLEAQRRIKSLSKAKGKGKKISPDKLRQIDNEIASLQEQIITPTKGLFKDLMITSTLASGAAALTGDPKVFALIPPALVLKEVYPEISLQLGKLIKSNVAKKALSEKSRRSANRIVSKLLQEEIQEEN